MTPEAEQLVIEHYSLIDDVARAVANSIPYKQDMDELRSLASMGLVMSADRWPDYCRENDFNPGALEYFVAYAKRRMRGAILDNLRSVDWVKRSTRTNAKRLAAAGLGEGATEEELAERTGMTVKEIRATRAATAASPVSLDGQRGTEDGESTRLDVADPVHSDGAAFETDVKGVVCRVIERLDPMTRVVLVLHYYLGQELQEVAAAVGINESRASALHSAGVLAVLAELRVLATDRELVDA